MSGEQPLATYRELAERISRDIRDIFAEMPGDENNVDFKKAIIVTGTHGIELNEYQEILGMKIYLCNMASYHDYYIAFNAPNKAEARFLRRHGKLMEWVRGLPSCYRVLTPKARKQHVCCECFGVIEIGERYYKHSGVWDVVPSTFKICDDCEQLRYLIRIECGFSSNEGFEFGALYGEILDGRHKDCAETFIAIATKRKSDRVQNYIKWGAC